MKSVFAKYITVFAVILLVSFLMLSSIISVSINDYAVDAQKNDMKLFSQVTASVVMKMQDIGPGRPDRIDVDGAVLLEILEAISPYTEETSFLITDATGRVLAINIRTEGFGEPSHIPVSFISEAANPENFFAQTDFNGMIPSAHLVYGSPITDNDGRVLGAVFVCSANAGADSLVQMMNQSITLANLWVMLAVMIAVYFITERLLSPVREMSQATKEFAKGNFATRIRVSGQDEIAEFAKTFNNMAAELEKSESLRSTFLANVSHDLRTPMTVIAGYIDGMLEGAIPEEKQEHYLRIVSGEIHRLSRLVSQLLDISRIEAGMRTFSPVNFDICEVARLILISFESKIDEKRLDVEFEPQDDRMDVHADRDAIHQVLYNLTENAIKFAKEGGKLKISISHAAKGKLLVRVYNEGQGVSEEDLPYIFDRFYKSDKSRGLDKIGVGLGLYIVKTMITASGESIRAESREGEYCAFEFTIARAE